MKRVCILQNSMTYGGTDTFVINLSRGLVRHGYKVTVVLSMDPDKDTTRIRELEDTGARIVRTCSLRGGLSAKLRHLLLLYRELRSGRYDVFQSNIDLFNGPQMLVARLAGVPVRECHSHNSQQGRELREGRTIRVCFYQAVMRWLSWHFSNRRGGCSGIAMDFLFGDRWRNDPYSRVVHNGIDLSEYRLPLDIQRKKDALGLKRKYSICTVGRLDHQKNPVFIVEVMNELFKLRDDCDFLWAGSGAMEDRVKSEIQNYGIRERMHLLGNRNDVSEILRCSDAFFLPSLFEGLGIVLIEAQAADLPCITSTLTPMESNCGAVLYLPLEESATYWAQQLSDVLDGRIELKVDPERLDRYSVEHMVSEMEGLFGI